LGALDRLQAAIKTLSEVELGELAEMAERIAKQREGYAEDAVHRSLATFARYRGTYQGDLDRESIHDR
jgi:hypothetical protein